VKTPAWKLFRAAAVCGVACLLLVLTGCVNDRTAGTDRIFTYAWWVPTLIFAGGIFATVGGWATLEQGGRWPFLLLIGGPIAFIFMAPCYFFSHATLGADQLNVRGGFWGLGSNQSVKYADLQEVHFVTEITTGRRGRKNTNHYFDCKLKDNSNVRLALSHDCLEKAAPEFLLVIRDRKIPLYDENGAQITFEQP
jgi:hypothetical protein